MRGKVAKKLRKFSQVDAADYPEVVYVQVIKGQEWKRVKGLPLNNMTVMGECQRAYYQQLKKIWKAIK